MKLKTAITFGVLFAFLALLSSCTTTTKLMSSWKDDNYTGGHIKSIMIVGISKNKYNRETFERAFVEQFKRKGVIAVASIDILPGGVEATKESIKYATEKLGIEAVVVTHLVSVDKDREVVPLSSHEYMRLEPYYAHTYALQFEPGYLFDKTTVQLESNIYETKTEKLIWSAQSRTISEAWETKVKYEIIKDVCKSLIKDLRKNGLLK